MLMLFGDALDAIPETVSAWETISGPGLALTMTGRGLADVLFSCLGFVHWLGPQLQQLVLPGKANKAAAAVRGLQEQQQQLQQVLAVAVWRLRQAAALLSAAQAARQPVQQQQQQQQQQQPMEADSTVYITSEQPWEYSPAAAAADAAMLAELGGSAPAAQPSLAELDPSGILDNYKLPAAAAAQLVGPEVPVLLRELGRKLWSALPQPRCCNNWACANLAGVSEAKLVRPVGSSNSNKCSGCKTAR
jgi:hypothetical protein